MRQHRGPMSQPGWFSMIHPSFLTAAMVVHVRGKKGSGHLLRKVVRRYLGGGYTRSLLSESDGADGISKSALIGSLTSEESEKIAPEFQSPKFMNPFRTQAILELQDSISFRRRVYLLVDDTVASPAVSLTYFCKDTGWTTLVGSRTGGMF